MKREIELMTLEGDRNHFATRFYFSLWSVEL